MSNQHCTRISDSEAPPRDCLDFVLGVRLFLCFFCNRDTPRNDDTCPHVTCSCEGCCAHCALPCKCALACFVEFIGELLCNGFVQVCSCCRNHTHSWSADVCHLTGAACIEETVGVYWPCLWLGFRFAWTPLASGETWDVLRTDFFPEGARKFLNFCILVNVQNYGIGYVVQGQWIDQATKWLSKSSKSFKVGLTESYLGSRQTPTLFLQLHVFFDLLPLPFSNYGRILQSFYIGRYGLER